MCLEWARFKPWHEVTPSEFEDNAWQDRNAITRVSQLKTVLDGIVSSEVMDEIESGLSGTGMSIRLNPYMICRIDWADAENDPIRRQFLPMRCEQEDDHPCLEVDSLAERQHSPVTSIVHRYPDKVLFLVTSVCPVYCQYCTRSYAVGQDTQLIQKDHVTSAQNWLPALDYIRSNSQIEDIVVSGGDLARLKPAHVRTRRVLAPPQPGSCAPARKRSARDRACSADTPRDQGAVSPADESRKRSRLDERRAGAGCARPFHVQGCLPAYAFQSSQRGYPDRGTRDASPARAWPVCTQPDRSLARRERRRGHALRAYQTTGTGQHSSLLRLFVRHGEGDGALSITAEDSAAPGETSARRDGRFQYPPLHRGYPLREARCS